MDRKQGTATFVIVLVGVALGALILLREPAPASGPEAGPAGGAEEARQETLVELSDAQVATAGIELIAAAPGPITTEVTFPGEIGFDENRTAYVLPLVSGVVQQVRADLGERVRKGQLLAVISSQEISELRSEASAAQRRLELAHLKYERERKLWEEGISAQQDFQEARQVWQTAEIELQNARQKVSSFGDTGNGKGSNYELRAPFDGVVVARRLAQGENVNGLNTGAESTSLSNTTNSAFTISDLSRVWANFSIAPRDLRYVQVGRVARVISPDLDASVTGTVSYVGNLLGIQTRTALARITLENPDGAWRPGLFVSVRVTTGAREARVRVPMAAIQTVDEQPVVFVRDDRGFVVRPVILGLQDGRQAEILQGLAAGERVAGAGSFILKSELAKGSAESSE